MLLEKSSPLMFEVGGFVRPVEVRGEAETKWRASEKLRQQSKAGRMHPLGDCNVATRVEEEVVRLDLRRMG